MPKAIATSTTDRRAFLGRIAAVSAMTLCAPAAQGSDTDAGLIDLCNRHDAIWRSIRKMEVDTGLTFGSPEAKAEEAALADLLDQEGAILARIATSPARTAKGIGAKAGAIKHYLRQYLDEMEPDIESMEIRAVFSLMDDVIAYASGALS